MVMGVVVPFVAVMKLVSSTLAKANISIFAISTYNTDYILVKDRDLEGALMALRNESFIIEE